MYEGHRDESEIKIVTIEAAGFRRYGGPEVLEVMRIPIPEAASGQVLIRVAAITVNAGEIWQRQGKLRTIARVSLPRFVGIDFSGQVVELGDGVTGFSVGDWVWGTVDELGSAGSAAELVAVDPGRIARMPLEWNATHAVSLLSGATTALVGLRDKAQLRRGERLLVRGAAGGVGSIAIQLGHMYGAHVTALASPTSEQFVRALGADEVIDYRTSLASIGTYDVVFDARGTDLWALRRLIPSHGRLVTISFDIEHKMRSLGGIAVSRIFGKRRIQFFRGHPTAALVEEVARFAEDGHLRPVIDSVYPLERIGDAQARLEAGGVQGKIVVTIGSPADAGSVTLTGGHDTIF